jgi:formamidopyrimidine-DNA glycosylase
MPELPEVETVRTGLERALVGQEIVKVTLHRPNLRYPFPDGLNDKIAGVPIDAVRRRAKYLLFDIGKHTLIGHLGMTGTYVVRPAASPLAKHDHMVWILQNGMEVAYHDPRRFGFLLHTLRKGSESHPMLAALGMEPLSDALNAAMLAARMVGKNTPIKSYLLDQQHIVGIGNIYASEALFLSRIHPTTPTKDCIPSAAALIDAIQTVLRAAIASGGSTLRNYANASGERGYFQHQFHVYGRADAPCVHCGTFITRITQAGRSSFFCPSCQKQGMS